MQKNKIFSIAFTTPPSPMNLFGMQDKKIAYCTLLLTSTPSTFYHKSLESQNFQFLAKNLSQILSHSNCHSPILYFHFCCTIVYWCMFKPKPRFEKILTLSSYVPPLCTLFWGIGRLLWSNFSHQHLYTFYWGIMKVSKYL